MNLFKINQYIFLLNNLYYNAQQLDSLRDLYYYIKTFNQEFNDDQIKEAVFFFIKLILSDSTHLVYFEGKAYGKENWQQFIEIYNTIYNNMVDLIKKGAEDGPPEIYNALIRTDVWLKMTEDWQNEVCKLSKMGFHNALKSSNENSKCKFDPNYRYQMPTHRFIPDNDCGCEE